MLGGGEVTGFGLQDSTNEKDSLLYAATGFANEQADRSINAPIGTGGYLGNFISVQDGRNETCFQVQKTNRMRKRRLLIVIDFGHYMKWCGRRHIFSSFVAHHALY